MFGEIWQFICAVVSFWADWSTGGPIVMAIALVSIFKEKEIRKKTWIVISIFFLLMGLFSAWESQKSKRIFAENDRDAQKQRADYNQKRIDWLSDSNGRRGKLLLALDNSVKNNPVITGNLGNASIVNNSSNVNVHQSVINPLSKPNLSESSLVAGNVHEGNLYKTTFLITVAHPTDKMELLWIKNAMPRLAAEPTMEITDSGFSIFGATSYNYKRYKITFTTFDKIQTTNVEFSVEASP
jgi:hypothetical protein